MHHGWRVKLSGERNVLGAKVDLEVKIPERKQSGGILLVAFFLDKNRSCRDLESGV